MIYPRFLEEGSTIGITAPSMGVGDKLEAYNTSKSRFLSLGYKVVETKSIKNKGSVSACKEIRAKEFNSLVRDNIDLILIARGGNFLFSCLPLLDLEKIYENPKWVMGYSDPTSILFSLTTKYDVATIYGFNATSFDDDHKCINQNLDILTGKIVKQNSYDTYYVHDEGTEKTRWRSNNDSVDVSGRIIGGCIEVLYEIAGTPFEDVKSFNERYQSDGIIWYFDIYDQTASEFYNTLLKFRYMDWFKNVKGVLVSRINSPIEDYITYEEAIKEVLPDIPYIMDTDIGHTFPRMTIINGAIARVKYEEGKGSLEFKLK